MLPGKAVLAPLLLLLGASQLSAQQWSATRVVVAGENEGLTVGRIAGIAAAADGRIYVLDAPESKVHILAPSGKLERSFGKRGAGPGELSAGATEIALSRGQIVVVDYLNQRVNLFNIDGSFVRSRPLSLTQGIPISWTSAGDRLVTAMRPMIAGLPGQTGSATQHVVIAFDPRSAAPADTLLRINLPMENQISMGATVRMKLDMRVPQVFLAGDGADRLLVATSDTYRIRMLNSSGKTAGWITRDVARRRYTAAEVARLEHEADSTTAAAMKSAMANAASAGGRAAQMPKPQVEFLLPEFAPVLSRLIAGNQFILVQRSIEKNKPSDWDVLTYDGKLAGTLRLPAIFSARAMVGDRVVGVEKDELDVESVVVYQIAPRR